MRACLPWRRWAAVAYLLVVTLASFTPPLRGHNANSFEPHATLEGLDVKRFTFLEQSLGNAVYQREVLSRRSLQQTTQSPPAPPSPRPPSPPSPPPPPAATYLTLPFRAQVVAVQLAQIPNTQKYFLYWRGCCPGNNPYIAATIDLKTYTSALLPIAKFNQFCNGITVLQDGAVAVIGGSEDPITGLEDGRYAITTYNAEKDVLEHRANMTFPRWYPTPLVLPNGTVLIVGGTNTTGDGRCFACEVAEDSELWDPSASLETPPEIVKEPPTFKRFAGYKWYPFMALCPRGEVLWWADQGGSFTDDTGREIGTIPTLTLTRTMYPYTSSITLHALKPDPETGLYGNFTLAAFGGQTTMDKYLGASKSAYRIDFWYCNLPNGTRICNSGWQVEDMLNQRRVAAMATVLPNGKIMVHGGATFGYAGLENTAIRLAGNSLMYDPELPFGQRFSFTGPIVFARGYHSTMCLDISGYLLAAGCETCSRAFQLPKGVSITPDGPYDFRLNAARPNEIGPTTPRPRIISAPSVIVRGRTFNVTYLYNGTITGASLAAPCADTHSVNMNQRVIFLLIDRVVANENIVTFRPLPSNQTAVAVPGWYMLFLLGDRTSTGRTYSAGVWIRVANGR